MSDLSPPKEVNHAMEDAGAHELDESSSDNDHFSDASEGRAPRSLDDTSKPASREATSPVPVTRVERVDDEPRYGEVPNTDAYAKRTADAVPDEVEIIPDGSRSRASTTLRAEDRPTSAEGSPVPKIVAEKIDPDEPAYGDVPGTEAYEKRKADAIPDEIIKSPASKAGSPWNDSNRSSSVKLTTAEQTQSKNDRAASADPQQVETEDDETNEGFGDDFDDFAEGGADDDDFGDFGDGSQDGTFNNEVPQMPQHTAASLPDLPVPTFHNTTPEQVQSIIQPYVRKLFPDVPLSSDPSAFPTTPTPLLTARSSSLWAQLSAPPPIQPPNWTRSHIRRMFLVSIGVPLDLDEILPPSKQKKLILPSLDLPGFASPQQRDSGEVTADDGGRGSGDGKAQSAVERLKGLAGEAGPNASSTSIVSTDSAGTRARKSARSAPAKGPPPPPPFEPSSATLLASTTREALGNMSDAELRAHLELLYEAAREARAALVYWTERADEALREKEAFEGVIENLVKHARSARG